MPERQLCATESDLAILRLADYVRGGEPASLAVQSLITNTEMWVHENARRWGAEHGATVVILVDAANDFSVVRRVEVTR